MNQDFLNGLLIVVYLLAGTISIVLLAGWTLKKFGSPKKSAAETTICDRRKRRASSPCKNSPRVADEK
jgi:hypothetical protein